MRMERNAHLAVPDFLPRVDARLHRESGIPQPAAFRQRVHAVDIQVHPFALRRDFEFLVAGDVLEIAADENLGHVPIPELVGLGGRSTGSVSDAIPGKGKRRGNRCCRASSGSGSRCDGRGRVRRAGRFRRRQRARSSTAARGIGGQREIGWRRSGSRSWRVRGPPARTRRVGRIEDASLNFYYTVEQGAGDGPRRWPMLGLGDGRVTEVTCDHYTATGTGKGRSTGH